MSGWDHQLTRDELRRVGGFGWREHVGDARGIWVRAASQRLMLVEGERVLRSYPCSTARAGLGNRRDSLRTPLGWHQVREKIGNGLPRGAILKSCEWTGGVWTPGEASDEDLILTRILRLTGLEEGHNLGGDVDTWERRIYIHGTNGEHLLGAAASHGCVRLANRDIMDLYDLIDVGCSTLITAE